MQGFLTGTQPDRAPFCMPITPHQLAKPGSEHAHQCALFQWIALSGTKRYPDMALAHAVPNGSVLIGSGTDRGRSEGSKMKAEGLKAGVPDVFVPVPLGMYPGLYVEMKKPGRQKEKDGGRSEDQVKWHLALRRQGYAVATCYNWMAGAQALVQYFDGSLVMPNDGDCIFLLGEHEPPW